MGACPGNCRLRCVAVAKLMRIKLSMGRQATSLQPERKRGCNGEDELGFTSPEGAHGLTYSEEDPEIPAVLSITA